MVFQPPRLAPVLEGAALVVLLLALACTGIMIVLGTPVVTLSTFFMGLWAFLILLLAAITIWRTYACWTLRYHLTRDALTIRWGYKKVIIPLGDIRELAPSQGKRVRWVRGIHWYAYHIASGMVEGLGLTHFYTTHLSPQNLVYVVAGGNRYGISLENPRRFARSLETCQRLGPLSKQEPRVEESLLVRLPLWRDPWMRALFLGGFIANLALFAYLSQRYPSIPSFLSLHYAPNGQVDRIGMKLEIFKLPGMALAVLGGNGLAGLLLHLKERYMALLVLAVALMVELLFWVAALQIVK